MEQIIHSGCGCFEKMGEILHSLNARKVLLVRDASFPYLHAKEQLPADISFVPFADFTPNPVYEDVCKGVDLFREEACGAILAVGGGSAIDVAKCVKLFCRMNPERNYLAQEYADTGVPLIAAPTTAGTGSESTRYAVVYYEGQKQSITHDSIRPDVVILEPRFLKTLPPYQKKCTMLDALCQGIESWWSVNSTKESRQYSQRAVRGILENYRAYLDGDEDAAEKILLAANAAGRAIHITQTTVPHAMSYKLTSLYGLPHGHAAAICLPAVWAYMREHTDRCVSPGGEEELKRTFREISEAFGCKTVAEAEGVFRRLLKELDICPPQANETDLPLLAASVNPTRLANNPVTLNEAALLRLYREILNLEERP